MKVIFYLNCFFNTIYTTDVQDTVGRLSVNNGFPLFLLAEISMVR